MIKPNFRMCAAGFSILVLLLLVLEALRSSWFSAAVLFSKSHPPIVLVLIGVAGEGAEILLNFFAKQFHDANKRGLEIVEAFCWILVVIGLAWEIPEASKADRDAAIARLETVKLEQEMASTSTNVVRLDPLNQTVSDVAADAYVVFKGTNFDELPISNLFHVGWLGLHDSETNLAVSYLGVFARLIAENFGKILDNGHPAYYIHFHPEESIRAFFENVQQPMLTATQVCEQAKVMTVFLGFIPNNAEVLSGNAKILINGRISKRFEILPQKSFVVPRAPWQGEDFVTLPGFTIIATNSEPIMLAPIPR